MQEHLIINKETEEVSIVDIVDEEFYTMDIEVENEHAYLLNNDIISHNTISMLTQTSSGIETVFMPYYVRRRKCVTTNDRVDYTDKLGINFTEFVVVHPQLKKWAEANMPELLSKFDELTEKEWEEIYKQSPWYESCAQDINW